MRQWEYMNVECDRFQPKDLNEFGKDGWEMIQFALTKDDKYVIFFKREMEKKVTIQQVLDDIDTKRIPAPTARVICVLREAMMFDKAVYLSQVSFRHRNFGKKSQTELRELIEHYQTSVR